MAHQFYFNSYILDNLPAPAKGFDVVQDISEPRLRMYITSRGVKTFFVRKRVRGKDKRILIGGYPDMDIEDARSAVPNILDGAMKKTPVRRKKILFKQFLDLYLENKIRRSEDSYVKLVRAINRHLGALFDKKVCEITTDDIRSVIDAISGRAIAGRMQELLQSIFNYAIEMGYAKENPEYLSFAVDLDGVHIGEVFAYLSEKEADIGWLIDKRYWGKGYATEAAKLLVEYLQTKLQRTDIVAYCDARNIASQKVMKNIGMEFAGSNGIRTYEKDVEDWEEVKYQLK